MSKRNQRIALLGTGIMGGHMAARLADDGFAVVAWNRTHQKAEALASRGVAVVEEVPEAVRDADIVICMLSSGPVCEEILLGPSGAISAMQKGAALAVMSSIPVETAILIGQSAVECGLAYTDAPVSGGEKGAKEGTLAIMAGGEVDDVERFSSIFSVLGRVTHVGPAGSGSLTKLANQLIVASTICAVAEALLLAEAGGANSAGVREALLGGFADSTVLRHHGLRMVNGDFHPGGPAKYQVKDTATALAFGHSRGLTLPVGEEVDRLFQSMVDYGDGNLDHSGIIIELRRMNGLETKTI